VEALFRLLTGDTERRARLHSIVRELRALVMFRNGLLHGPWGAYVGRVRRIEKCSLLGVKRTP
jgi:hypothetical protein